MNKSELERLSNPELQKVVDTIYEIYNQRATENFKSSAESLIGKYLVRVDYDDTTGEVTQISAVSVKSFDIANTCPSLPQYCSYNCEVINISPSWCDISNQELDKNTIDISFDREISEELFQHISYHTSNFEEKYDQLDNEVNVELMNIFGKINAI